jgi:hypothetical protein
MMEGDITRFWNTKCKTCATTKDNDDAKRSVLMMARRHGGMACMAQDYHGDGDVDICYTK